MKKNNPGYVRFFDLTDSYPMGTEFEADEIDINFLKELFPSDFKNSMTQEDLARNDIVREFERVIIYLDETED